MPASPASRVTDVFEEGDTVYKFINNKVYQGEVIDNPCGPGLLIVYDYGGYKADAVSDGWFKTKQQAVQPERQRIVELFTQRLKELDEAAK